MLQTLADTILEVVEADSAGISLLSKDAKSFYWPAIAGEWKPHTGGGTPRDFAPCGDVLDRDAPLLFTRPHRRYASLAAAKPSIEECLVVPFHVDGKAIGTIWAIAHDQRRKFDAEDLRLLVSLGGFASSACRAHGAQEDLRESDERYRSMFDSLDEGFCIIEMMFDERGKAVDYIFLEVNQNFVKQCGMVDATGKRMREMAPNHEERWFEIYGKVATTGEPIRFEQQAKELGESWFDLYAFRIGGTSSRKVAVIFSNISRRKQAEQELRESEERYRNLFNSMDEGFCIIKMIFDESDKPVDYRFLEVNPSFERQTGMRDVIGRLVSELVPNLEPVWAETYGKVALTGEPARFSSEVKGLNRWLEIYAARLGGPENRNVAVLFSNITDRKRAQESVQEINKALDRTVQERTRELTAANKELESFCYSVSHDLRAPLRGIMSFSQIIQRRFAESLDLEARRLLSRVEQSSRRMSRIIDGLLSLSRLTRGDIELRQIDITAVARSLGQELLKDEAKRVDFKVQSGLVALGDENLLRLVLQNLLQNAFKFTARTARPAVEVGLTKEGAFFVRDNGAGFDPEFADKLFQPFQRLHGENEFPGDGIGLATVQRAVQRLGGKVRASSKPGQGATFFFSLAG